MGGQVDSYFANISSGLPYIHSGQLRPLAVSSITRLKQLPDVPTVAESGFKDFEVLDWHGIFVPAGTPQPVIDRLAGAVRAATADQGVAGRLDAMGIQPAYKSATQFAAFLGRQIDQWTALIKERHISLN
jgi:tripartite-type tricarboxylate transporter receptor subunit TctC